MGKTGVYIVILLFLSSCLHSEKEKNGYLAHADFDPESRVLSINPGTALDTVLQQVIILSGTRHKGYGILLNIEGAASPLEIDTLIYKFRKLDINAVHRFDVQSDRPAKNHVLVAANGAKFIWIISGNNTLWSSASLLPLSEAMQNAVGKGGIIVVSQNFAEELRHQIRPLKN